MWGCIPRLLACRRMQNTTTTMLAHAAGLQCFGVGPAHVSSSATGGQPHAAATYQPCTSTSRWLSSSSSNLSSVADASGSKQSHSNEEEGAPQQAATELERQLTRQIRDSAAVEKLEQIVCERGSSFSAIHTAAALTRFAKLRRSGQGGSGLLQQLVRKWLQQLPDAGVRECSSVLGACVNLSKQQVDAVWGPTWVAFMQHVAQGSRKGLVLQDISSAVQAAAQLRKQPGADELQLLVQAFLQPDVLEGANSQDIEDLTGALDHLLALPGLQGVVSEQDMQQLLDKQRLLGEQQAARLITRQIRSAETVAQLSGVSDQWGGSFDTIHAAAALFKFAKLSNERQTDSYRDSQLLQLLVRKWLQLLPEAGPVERCSTPWACANLSKQHQQQVSTIWGPTWAAFMQHMRQQSQEEQQLRQGQNDVALYGDGVIVTQGQGTLWQLPTGCKALCVVAELLSRQLSCKQTPCSLSGCALRPGMMLRKRGSRACLSSLLVF